MGWAGDPTDIHVSTCMLLKSPAHPPPLLWVPLLLFRVPTGGAGPWRSFAGSRWRSTAGPRSCPTGSRWASTAGRSPTGSWWASTAGSRPTSSTTGSSGSRGTFTAGSRPTSSSTGPSTGTSLRSAKGRPLRAPTAKGRRPAPPAGEPTLAGGEARATLEYAECNIARPSARPICGRSVGLSRGRSPACTHQRGPLDRDWWAVCSEGATLASTGPSCQRGPLDRDWWASRDPRGARQSSRSTLAWAVVWTEHRHTCSHQAGGAGIAGEKLHVRGTEL